VTPTWTLRTGHIAGDCGRRLCYKTDFFSCTRA